MEVFLSILGSIVGWAIILIPMALIDPNKTKGPHDSWDAQVLRRMSEK